MGPKSESAQTGRYDRNTNVTSYNLQRVNVLVVEGHRMMRRLMHDVLATLGCKNIEVVPAQQLDKPEHATFVPDVIFADWSPSCDGLSLIKDIRFHRRNFDRFMPIVMVSAYTEVRQVCAARDAGITEFLAKPLTAGLIYRRICALVENPRDFVETKSYFGPDRRRRALGPNGPERRNGAGAGLVIRGGHQPERPALADLIR